MAEWEKFRETMGSVANKAAKKTEELAQSTAKYIRLKTMDAKLSSKYETLGRLTYKQIKEEVSQAERISRVIEEIDSLRAQRKALKAEIEADKQKRAEEREKALAADSATEEEEAN